MVSLDLDSARSNMLVNQIRAWEVLNPEILDTIAAVPRERFVPDRFRHLAFADELLPIGHGQVMFAPKYEGRFLQALDIQAADRVLEIGTGTGYMAALLGRRARQVVSVELYEDFVAGATQRLRGQGYQNVRVVLGDGCDGWPQEGPYDVMLVTGSLPTLPESLLSQLKPGGRLGVIVGQSPVMQAQVITKTASGSPATSNLFEADLPPLVNAVAPDPFEF